MKPSERISRVYSAMLRRCNDQTHDSYRSYGGKGIKVLMTKDDLWKLWYRDSGEKLSRPSIDRVDSKGHYELSNCRFIEFRNNAPYKLTKEQHEEIRRRFSGGESYKKLAKEYGIHRNTAWGIIKGWDHLRKWKKEKSLLRA